MPGGRPTVMTDEVISKLEEAFLWGCSDLEACLYANISAPTLYRYQEDNPEFRERKAALKTSPIMRSKQIISQALDDRDLSQANKVMDRAEGKRLKLEGGDRPVKLESNFNITPVKGSRNVGPE